MDVLIHEIDRQLGRFGAERSGLTLRQKVQRLVEIAENFKDLGINAAAESGLTASQARERIRLYLVEYVTEAIAGAELAVVAGISDYPRRIRELRREEGYQIASGASPDPSTGIVLKPDEYLLVREIPDADAARRWHVANRIRRSGGGAKGRLLAFLRENVGHAVTTEELAYVAKAVKDYPRRVRELRTEEGYSIATRLTGRPDLGIGQYILQSVERVAEPHDRHVPAEVEQAVYSRDRNTCRMCGWSFEQWTAEDPRVLELHHLQHHQHGGANEERNLIVLCSRCHDEVHAGRQDDVMRRIEESL